MISIECELILILLINTFPGYTQGSHAQLPPPPPANANSMHPPVVQYSPHHQSSLESAQWPSSANSQQQVNAPNTGAEKSPTPLKPPTPNGRKTPVYSMSPANDPVAHTGETSQHYASYYSGNNMPVNADIKPAINTSSSIVMPPYSSPSHQASFSSQTGNTATTNTVSNEYPSAHTPQPNVTNASIANGSYTNPNKTGQSNLATLLKSNESYTGSSNDTPPSYITRNNHNTSPHNSVPGVDSTGNVASTPNTNGNSDHFLANTTTTMHHLSNLTTSMNTSTGKQ